MGNIPHASKQLDQTTIGESGTNDHVGLSDVLSAHVDSAQHESGEGESAQAERSRVTELAALNGLVQTGLELTTEGRETGLVGVDLSQRAIAEASGSPCSGVLLSRHLGLDDVAVVGGLVGEADVLLDAGVVRSFRRHCESLGFADDFF